MERRKSFINQSSISDYGASCEIQEEALKVKENFSSEEMISIPETTWHKLSKLLESHFMSQVKTIQAILDRSPEAIADQCLCKGIVPLCQQLFSETVASGKSIINLCNSFTKRNLSSTFKDFIDLQHFFDTEVEQISLPNVTEEVHNILMNNPSIQLDPNQGNDSSNLVVCKIEDNGDEIPEVYIDKDNPEKICDIENIVKVEELNENLEKVIESEDITNLSDDDLQNAIQSKKSKLRKKNMQANKKDLYSCSFCTKKYKSKGFFIKHEKAHEDRNNTDESSNQNSVTENTEGSLIDFEFIDIVNKQNQKDLNNELSNQISNKQLSCEICDKSFTSIITFNQHKTSHGSKKDLSCNYCEQVCKTKSKLALHLRTHTGERPFICEVCGASFIRRSGLYEHQFTHSKEKPFSCSQCDYKCRTQKILNFHLVVHSNEKSFQCDECGKTFSRGINLRHHLYTHAEVRPFPCNICEKRFVTKCQMKRHRRIHENNLPYSCEICGKKSTQSYNIVVHMRTHTGQKPFSCEICGKTFAHNVTLRQHKNICDGSNDIKDSTKS